MQRLIISVLSGIIGGIFYYLIYSTFSSSLEPFVLEAWFNIRGPIAKPKGVVLVAMDEDSYEELELPMSKVWPRELHAQLLDRMASAGAKRVAFDVVFAGPSDSREADLHFEQSLKKLPTVIGMQLDNPTGTSVAEGNHLILPYEPFRSAASLALVALPNEEESIRHFKTSRDVITEGFPTLSEAAVNNIRLKPAPQDFIWYYGGAESVEVVSYYAALDPELTPDELFKDQVVFVGLWMQTGLGPTEKDTFSSPFWTKSNLNGQVSYERGRIFGVEVHATAAANLMHQNWIKRASFYTESLVSTVIVATLIALVIYLGPLYGALFFLAAMLLWCFVSYEFFLSLYFVPGLVAIITVAIAYLNSLLIFYLFTYRSQKNTMRALSMYVSPIVAKQTSKDPKLLALGGKLINCTALFTDIADFTTISESMSAERVSKMLNEYFTQVMEVVQNNQGSLNKFIGDAIFALWGAPLMLENHAEKAVMTALAIERGVKQFNLSSSYPELVTRIGVHTGDMIVGNLGTRTKLDYTAIGDAVNLASRLEGLNKYFGTTILISESSAKQVTSPYLLTRMGVVAVKGKEQSIRVYTIFDPPLTRLVESGWREAQDEFCLRAWSRCELILSRLESLEPRLRESIKLYLDNIAICRLTPPDDSWQGSIRFGSK